MPSAIRAGKLDRSIGLLERTQTRDEQGAVQESYSVRVTVWAEVRPLSASERFTSFADHSARTNYFRIRYRGDVTPMMRIRYEGLDWEIKGITEVGRQEALDIFAEVIY